MIPKLLGNNMIGVRDWELIIPTSASNSQACVLKGHKQRGRGAGHKLNLKEGLVPTKGSHHCDPAITTACSQEGGERPEWAAKMVRKGMPAPPPILMAPDSPAHQVDCPHAGLSNQGGGNHQA